MSSQETQAYLFGHFSDEVSRSTLGEMLSLVQPGRRVALLGFSDYTKHLINNFGDNVVEIYEVDERFVGFEFRGKVVRSITELAGARNSVDEFVICVFDDLVTYTDVVHRAGLGHLPLLWPEDFDGRPGHQYAIEAQSALYRYVPRPDRLGEPATMMPRETILFLIELLRSTLRVEGAVAEIGVWQGGSGWNMAKVMDQLGDRRPLHLFDFFDEHVRSNPEAIMCLDEIRARFAFYDPAQFYRGFANELMTAISDQTFCFVHIDLGYMHDVLEFFWDRLAPGGIMAFDNYGHVRAWPGEFDRFFADRNYSVVRVPFSYQAFVIK